MSFNKQILHLLDNLIAPKGVFDEQAFDYFYNKYSEDLMYIGEPDEDDEDDWGGWSDSTLKHKIFTYGPVRPKKLKTSYPSDKNDLPFVLAYFCHKNTEFTSELLTEIVKYKK